MHERFRDDLQKLCQRYHLNTQQFTTQLNHDGSISHTFSVYGHKDAENPMAELYDHTRSLREVVSLMEKRHLSEVFLCGKMFRVMSINNTFQKIRFFEVTNTHEPHSALMHVGDFDTKEGWAAKALLTGLQPYLVAPEVIAELVTMRMGL